VVVAAIEQDGDSLQYASEQMQNRLRRWSLLLSSKISTASVRPNGTEEQ